MLLSSSYLEQDHSTANITIIIPVPANVISTFIKLRNRTVIESYACGYVFICGTFNRYNSEVEPFVEKGGYK